MPRDLFTDAERAALLALAGAILPGVGRLPAAGEGTVRALARLLVTASPRGVGGVAILTRLLDFAALFWTGRRFRSLPPAGRERLIRRWERTPLLRWLLFALAFLLKSVYFDDPALYRALGCVYEKGGPDEPARWLSQVRPGAAAALEGDLECDVVVVGTGAGGAVVGRGLAERGHAVVFLEEGELHRRDSFRGSALDAHHRFYRARGTLAAVGNAVIPVLMGRLVGGSTAINTGTCFRTPPWVLDRWCERLRTDDFSESRMRPYFEGVERFLGVTPNDAKTIGAIGAIVARGCDRLGWSHFPIPRNAPECDGQGVCDFGCPTGARRSMDVSYIPAALARGAVLLTGTRAESVLIENGRAVGVAARAGNGGREVRVRSRAVVLAGGAIPTPLLLLAQGICNRSGQVGRNLSIHPATTVSALFEERVEGYNHIPQGYACDQFHREGILLLGAQASINVGSVLFPFSGKRLMAMMNAFAHVATFAVLVEDSRPAGRVRPGLFPGRPLITYFLAREDLRRLHEGTRRIMEIFRAAGADRFFPIAPRMPVVEGDAGFRRFTRWRPRPWDFLCTSFHPLGACRMGRDPRRSVVGTDHETHEIPGLFIVDGSTVPGPTAVNPQLTIMAMAARAAELIAARLRSA